MPDLPAIRERIREDRGICPECRKSPFDPTKIWALPGFTFDKFYYCGTCHRRSCAECMDRGVIESIGDRMVPCKCGRSSNV